MNFAPDVQPDQPSFAELLAECEREPIHIPGAIQPHGTLLAADESRRIVVASADAAGALDRTLDDVLGDESVATLTREALGQPLSLTVRGGQTMDAIAHRSGGLLVVELEPPSDVDLDGRLGVLAALRRLQAASSVIDLAERTVDAVRTLTGFDRVMIYRFDDEWNGEVIAEHRLPDLDPFLGLRYPASDIPPQARALYLRNRIRLIPTSHHEPVPLVTTADHADDPPLDLSDATLRAVSPVHLEYLRNMDVDASMSAALVVDGRLWGLVACHHYTAPRRPSQRVRAAVDVVAHTASALLGQLLAAAAANERLALFTQLDALTARLADADVNPLAALATHRDGMQELLAADGAATVAAGAVQATGTCPPADTIAALVQHLETAGRDSFVTSHVLASELTRELADAIAPHAAGVVAARVRGDRSAWLLWFRREQIESVRWGGDPTHKEMKRDPTGGLRLGPRRSFAEYVDLVRERSIPWRDAEVDAARELARRVADSNDRQVRRDRVLADAMQRAVLLDALPDVPGAEVAVLYEPATRFGVGGDWYDLFFLPDGRAVIALGDVAGHGFEVAATMAQMRHALRAYVVRTGRVDAALGELNELARTLLPGEMATVVVAAFSPERRSIDIANAGHLPPVLTTGDGASMLALPRHPALGLRHGIEFTATTVTLDRSATILLYTDGLVERRDLDLVDQLDALVRQATELRNAPVDSMCTRLRDSLRDDAREDDATIFAFRFTE